MERNGSSSEPHDLQPIRVLIVDDHPMVRDMIRLGCEEDPTLDVVGEASNGNEALDQCRRLRPDVLLLDLVLPGLSGFDIVRMLREEDSAVRILVLTNRDDREAVFESVRLKVDGFLEKRAPLDRIVQAIRDVAAGREVFSEEHERLAQTQLADLARTVRTAAKAASALTRRERDVLELIAEGLTTRQMASRLRLSERTVETHIANLYEKLGVKTRVQAVHRAANLGLIDLESP